MALGSWMLAARALGGRGPGPPWPVLHTHLLTVGFLLLLIFGVEFWMFPRVRGARSRAGLGWLAFGLINAGLVARVVAEPVADAGRGPAPGPAVLAGAAVLPTVGALAFAVTLLPRIRAAMTPQEARRLRAARGLEDRP